MNSSSTNLDVLRSLAVIFVVVSHLFLEKSLVKAGNFHIQTLGTLGVLIFFVHTCLVLMLSLERQAKEYSDNSATVPFLVQRAFRIYPLSIVVVITTLLTQRLFGDGEPTLLTLVSNILLIQNLTGSPSVSPVLWSLPYEIQMYLFLPALYISLRGIGESAPRSIVALWLVTILLVMVFRFFGWNFDLIKFFPCFLPGVLAFSLRHVRPSYSPTILLIYVGIMAVLYPLIVGMGFNATVPSWFICFVLGVIIPRCREIESIWVRVVAGQIARYSYGIYLLHVPLIFLSFHYIEGIPQFLSWAIFLVGIAGLPYFVHNIIEKPGIQLGQFIANRLRRKAIQPKPYR